MIEDVKDDKNEKGWLVKFSGCVFYLNMRGFEGSIVLGKVFVYWE